MNKLMFNVSRANMTAILSILWTVVCAVLFLGWVSVDNQIIEKAYSIEMIVIAYYLRSNTATDKKA